MSAFGTYEGSFGSLNRWEAFISLSNSTMCVPFSRNVQWCYCFAFGSTTPCSAERSGDMHIPKHLCLFVRHVQARTHMFMTSPPSVLCDPHMYPLSLRAHNNEPSSRTTTFMHPAWSSEEMGDGSWTERHLLPTAAKPGWGEGQRSGGLFLQQRSVSSHDPHAPSLLSNDASVVPSVQPHLKPVVSSELCSVSMKSSSLCSTVQAITWFNNSVLWIMINISKAA